MPQRNPTLRPVQARTIIVKLMEQGNRRLSNQARTPV